jgi:hypothetical protein
MSKLITNGLRHLGSATDNVTLTSGGGFATKGITDNASATSISIDSSGRVTKPYQPMFNVRNDTGQSISSGTGNQTITFGAVNNNVGSHYSTSTNRFTAPVAGYYFFAFNAVFDSPGNVRVCEFGIRVNGASDYSVGGFSSYDFNAGNEHPGISLSSVIYMNSGDYCTINQRTHVDISGTSNLRGGANGFSGYLLG